jgi:hypothetical protein
VIIQRYDKGNVSIGQAFGREKGVIYIVSIQCNGLVTIHFVVGLLVRLCP